MDLAFGAQRLIVAMAHTAGDGASRVRRRCEYPLTAPGVYVDRVVQCEPIPIRWYQ